MADGCVMPAETWIPGRLLGYWWYCSHAIATVPLVLPSAAGEDGSDTAGQKCLHLSCRPEGAPVRLAPFINRRWSASIPAARVPVLSCAVHIWKYLAAACHPLLTTSSLCIMEASWLYGHTKGSPETVKHLYKCNSVHWKDAFRNKTSHQLWPSHVAQRSSAVLLQTAPAPAGFLSKTHDFLSHQNCYWFCNWQRYSWWFRLYSFGSMHFELQCMKMFNYYIRT